VKPAVVAVLAALGAFAAEASGGAPPQPAIVSVTLRDADVTLNPSSVIAGTVVFKIANKGRMARDFEIGGNKTPAIAAGKTATLRTRFAGHPYRYVSVGERGTDRLTGFLGVFPGCPNPTATTVTVDIKFGDISLSQTTVPCGTVTFEVTNTDVSLIHDLNFAQPTKASGDLHGPRLRPGQSTKIVVNLLYKGQVFYFCREYEHDENGETGLLIVR
jgi:hypothetical protein